VEDLKVLLRARVRAGHIVTTEREDRDRRSGPAAARTASTSTAGTICPAGGCGTQVRTQEMVARNLYWCRSASRGEGQTAVGVGARTSLLRPAALAR
jgi:formamidopyrimidine-DNA glycosylase